MMTFQTTTTTTTTTTTRTIVPSDDAIDSDSDNNRVDNAAVDGVEDDGQLICDILLLLSWLLL
jgi:hypothetical protein